MSKEISGATAQNQNNLDQEAALAKPTTVYFLCLLVAICSMFYELSLAQMTSILYGDSFLRYSLSIGFYLVGLALGATLSDRYTGSRKKTYQTFLLVEILLCLLGQGSIYFIVFVEKSLFEISLSFPGVESVTLLLGLAFAYGMSLTLGLFSGAEIPLLAETINTPESDHSVKVLASDYSGSSLGALLFPLIIFPHLSLIQATSTTALINIGVAFTFLWFMMKQPEYKKTGSKPYGFVLLSLAVLALSASNLLFAESIENALSSFLFSI